MGAENAGTMFLQAQQDLLRMSTPTAEQQHDDDEGWVEVIEEVQ
jgi:hypothetical protein